MRGFQARLIGDVVLRNTIGSQYLSGSGMEIGALQNPLKLPSTQIRVKYVDRMTKKDLQKHYPELRQHNLVDVDVIDDGETLTTFSDHELDFIIANHFLEHCEDPIRTLKNFWRVLRPDGLIYLAIPDKRLTFDKNRTSTTIDHLVKDHEEGPANSRRFHFEEWVRLVEPHVGRSYNSPEEVEQRVDELDRMNYSIHFHNWAPEEFEKFLEYVADILPLKIELFVPMYAEMVVVLRSDCQRRSSASQLSK